MKWVTRERPKIDRIACPWLIERFIEKQPEFLYVPADKVLATAKETGAIPYDIPDVKFSHVGEKCSFDAFIAEYKLDAPGLDKLADEIRIDAGRHGDQHDVHDEIRCGKPQQRRDDGTFQEQARARCSWLGR